EFEEVEEDALEEVEELEEEEEDIVEIDEEELAELQKFRKLKEESGKLHIISEYLDPEEALQGDQETLAESQEDYVAQIMKRFTPKFIKIPGGEYHAGCIQPTSSEHFQENVTLQPFYFGQIPVTNDLFDFFVRDTGYETDAERAGFGTVYEGRCMNRTDPETGRETFILAKGTTSRQVEGANWRHPAGPGSSLESKHNHPVVQISFRDARVFAVWAGKRLPTEEEWEAAARGEEAFLFPWGNTWNPKNGNFEASFAGDTIPVDRYITSSTSPFGIYDLLGNVYEWTASIYTNKSKPPPKRPGDKIHILKGGCWTSNGIISACHRLLERENFWSNIIGFRCAV
ncbi:MAG: SUMF1/EgtB/PvdO family nonheme iron enzyme, partial [Desulfobulbaceae bacterium]|nr:SUMF1/EgtB/PvdO family nonheme iron enzyme [Desulfobulbaceae bacterium]